MTINKNLVLLWILCSVFIFIAISYKLEEVKKQPKTITAETNNDSETIEMSPVFYNTENNNTTEPNSSTTIKISPTSAKSYLVGNVKTGEIYLIKNPNTVLPVASMSKLITAIESIDQFSMSGTTTVIKSELTPPDLLTFETGEKFSIEEALYPLLVNSSNVIAETLASTTDRIKFMDLMSSYAWEIGMPSTYFADPSGISPQNISSAKDFFTLAKYLYKFRPDILNITKTSKYILATTTEHGYHEINSTHPFVNDPNFLGGKTGRTPQAGDTMLTILNIKDSPIAFVVLGSKDRKKDTLYLISELNKILD
jgi:D-alanyl-D-alanine carboxypeptidase